MPFVPTEKQVNSLYFLLKQLVRENVEIRLIRFAKWAEGDIRNCEIELLCLEDIDRYIIYYDGVIIQDRKRRF